MPAQLEPPPNPYGVHPAPPGPSPANGARIVGVAGDFAIRPGAEIRVGRDPAICPVCLSEPRVSGVHATLKFEGARLWVRDETSNNGTWLDGNRLAPGQWAPVPAGARLRFGPIEFDVRME
jgi:pSer/pThr/pTyr-binding forkhead associated (FHA) protein